jgi:hypothetical protein
MPTPVLNKFLARHAQTLRSVAVRKVYLSDWLSMSTSWHDVEDPDDDDEPEPKYTAPRDGSWFSVFEQLAAMAKLEEVCLSELDHDNFNGPSSLYRKGDPALQTLGGGYDMTASGGEVAGRLGRAVQQRVTVVHEEVSYREYVWFSERV